MSSPPCRPNQPGAPWRRPHCAQPTAPAVGKRQFRAELHALGHLTSRGYAMWKKKKAPAGADARLVDQGHGQAACNVGCDMALPGGGWALLYIPDHRFAGLVEKYVPGGGVPSNVLSRCYFAFWMQVKALFALSYRHVAEEPQCLETLPGGVSALHAAGLAEYAEAECSRRCA